MFLVENRLSFFGVPLWIQHPDSLVFRLLQTLIPANTGEDALLVVINVSCNHVIAD